METRLSVVRRVTNVEIIFLYQWRVKVKLSGEGDRQWWCEFNTSVLAREGRRRNEALHGDVGRRRSDTGEGK
jgi:hypothetical protein